MRETGEDFFISSWKAFAKIYGERVLQGKPVFNEFKIGVKKQGRIKNGSRL